MGLTDSAKNFFSGATDRIYDATIEGAIGPAYNAIVSFIFSLLLAGYHAYFYFLVILFFGLVSLIVWVPYKLYPVYKQNQALINRFLKLTE